MDIDTRRQVVRAARTLLQWDQERFAKALKVGTSTLKRYERTVAKMLDRLGRIGIAVINRRTLDGFESAAGVALL